MIATILKSVAPNFLFVAEALAGAPTVAWIVRAHKPGS